MLLARGANILLGLAFIAGATRLLSPAAYGQLAYVIVVATLVAMVSTTWTTAAVIRYGREQLEAHGSMLSVTWNRLLIAGPVLALCVGVLLGGKLAGAFPPEFSWALLLTAVAFGTSLALQDHLIAALQATGRMKWSALALTVQQGLAIIALAVVVFAGLPATPVALALVLGGATAASASLFMPMVWTSSLWPPTFDRPLMRRLVVFSTPLIAFALAQYLIRWVDLVAIRAYGTARDVGIYTVAYQGYSALQTLISTSTTVLIPLFVSLRAGRSSALITTYFRRVVPQLTLVGAVFAGLAAPFCSLLVPLAFGSAFGASARPLEILLVSLVLLLTASLLAPIVVLHERTREIGMVSLLAAAVNIVADFLLIGPAGMGIDGAAVATGLATGVIAVGYYRVASACLGVSAPIPPAFLLPVAAGVAPAVWLPGPAGFVVGIAAVLFSTAALVIALRPFEARDADLIEALDAPDPIKRLGMRAIALLAR